MSEKTLVVASRPSRPTPGRSALRRWAWRLGIVAAVLTALTAAASLVIGRYSRRMADELVAKALPEVEARTGLHVMIGGIEPGLFGTSVLRDVVVQSNQVGFRETFVRVPAIRVLHKISLRDRTVVLKGVRLEQASVVVELYPDGQTNLPDLLSRLRDKPAEAAAAGGRDGLMRKLLGGGDELTLSLDGGSLIVRDLGRFRASEPIITSFYDADGEVRVNFRTRQIHLNGSAEQGQSHGRLFLETTISANRMQATAKLEGVMVDGLNRLVPFAARLAPTSRLSGRVQVTKDRGDSKWFLSVDASADHVDLAHPRLASTEVRDFRAGLQGALVIDPVERSMATDELVVRLGNAPLRLVRSVLRYPPGGKPFLDATLEARQVPLQDVLDGLPEQLVPVIHGARFDGFLDFGAHLLIDMDRVENSRFEAQGDVRAFQPVSVPPRCDVRRLRDPDYKHLARRYGLLQKTIVLGPTNPDFVPFSGIGNLLRSSVMICEDGSFFHHHGFLPHHINDSLRMNLREKRFARGASTITMQLVKNLFLSEEKTLSRKLQEVMLTWWIEREIPKERMFEIYMNIIELGPRIYGCGPAAEYFFHCRPSALSPVQAAWLASIISNPERHPKPYYGEMVALIVRRLASRGLITPEEMTVLEETYFKDTTAAPGQETVTLPGDEAPDAPPPPPAGKTAPAPPAATPAP